MEIHRVKRADEIRSRSKTEMGESRQTPSLRRYSGSNHPPRCSPPLTDPDFRSTIGQILMTTGAESHSTHFGLILALANRMGAVGISVIALYFVSGLVSPGMFHVDQVLNILQVSAFLGVAATGQTLPFLVAV